MDSITNLTDVAAGTVDMGSDLARKESFFFTITYENGQIEDKHFTVGLKHKTMEDAKAACIEQRNKLARNNNLAA